MGSDEEMNKDIMKELGFGEGVEAVEAGLCPSCKKPVTEADFRDALSAKEFYISGFCQQCHDSVFGKPKKKARRK